MVLHFKKSETAKTKVNEYIKIYLKLMFIFPMSCFVKLEYGRLAEIRKLVMYSSIFLSDLKNQTIVSSCVTHILPSCGYFKGQEQIFLTLLVGIW